MLIERWHSALGYSTPAPQTILPSPHLNRPKPNLRDAIRDRGLKPNDFGLTEETNSCEAKSVSNMRSRQLHRIYACILDRNPHRYTCVVGRRNRPRRGQTANPQAIWTMRQSDSNQDLRQPQAETSTFKQTNYLL